MEQREAVDKLLHGLDMVRRVLESPAAAKRHKAEPSDEALREQYLLGMRSPFVLEWAPHTRLIEQMVVLLPTERDVARSLDEAMANCPRRSLWSSDPHSSVSGSATISVDTAAAAAAEKKKKVSSTEIVDCAAVLCAHWQAARAERRQPTCNANTGNVMGGTLAERTYWVSLSSAAFRPFLTRERLTELAHPMAPERGLLLEGDVLHVPFTQTECQTLLRHLKQPLPAVDRRISIDAESELHARQLRTLAELPGRALVDVRAFMSQVKLLIDDRTCPLHQRVVVYTGASFYRTLESQQSSSLVSRLARRSFMGVSGAAPLSVAAQSAALATVHIGSHTNTAQRFQAKGAPVDCKFSPPGASFRALVAGCTPSAEYELVVFNLDARPGEPGLRRLYGHGDAYVSEVQWSCEGSMVLSSGSDCAVRAWDPVSGAMLQKMRHSYDVKRLSVGRSTERLVASVAWDISPSAAECRLFDVYTGETLLDMGTLHTFGSEVHAQLFVGAADERWVSGGRSGSKRDVPGDVVMVDLEAKTKVLHVRPHRSEVTCLAVGPDRTLFLSGAWDRRALLYDVRVDNPVVRVLVPPAVRKPRNDAQAYEVQSMGFSASGQLVHAGYSSNDAHVWDLRASDSRSLHHLVHKMPSFDSTAGDQGVYASQWMPFASTLLTGGEDGMVRVWDFTRGDPAINAVPGHSRCVTAIGLSYEGTAFASGGDDSQVNLYADGTRFRLSTVDDVKGPRPDNF